MSFFVAEHPTCILRYAIIFAVNNFTMGTHTGAQVVNTGYIMLASASGVHTTTHVVT